MLESSAILIGGIFALVELVIAALLDFFRRERRSRYDMFSRSASQRMFRAFAGVTLVEWIVLITMQLLLVPPVLGWPIFGVCFAGKIFLLQKDFARRRTDVANGMFRIAQYQFLAAALALVGISYYVHSRPKSPASTAPAAGAPGILDGGNSAGNGLSSQ